jgi:hypothetical protein
VALFGAARQARRDDKELGKGIWRRTHDRFRRGLDRYHQVLEGVQDEELYGELLAIADELAALLPKVRASCMLAQELHPSDGMDIPGGSLAAVHRCLSKAGNSLAAAAQAAAMIRLDPGHSDTSGGSATVENVRRRADIVIEDVADAQRYLETR